MNIEKAIMLSLHPRWCEKISNVIFHSTDEIPVYEKFIEIRKTRPKIQTPFKVYIYCTKPNLPKLSGGNTAIKIEMTSTPSIAARYDNGTDDYQAIFSLSYKHKEEK